MYQMYQYLYAKMNSKLLFYVVLLLCVIGDTLSQCDGTFRFASYYGDSMVLQRAPESSLLWGHAAQTGLAVQVDVAGEIYNTETFTAPFGTPIWSVTLNPRDPQPGPVQITASIESCSITISDVLFGDIWVCSGQSNMVLELQEIDNPDSDIADAVNYPSVRTFWVGNHWSGAALEDLDNIKRSWTLPDSTNMATFSAVCWLFGKDLNQELGIPIGLFHVAMGGTRIETWSPTEALDVCFPDGVDEGKNDANNASALYNAMINPLTKLPIKGVLWYQGEANNRDPDGYACAISEMVKQWRSKWSTNTQLLMPAEFPFGQVQLAPNAEGDVDHGFPDLRWAQTSRVGYTPNPLLSNVFTAIALDLPDYDSPNGAIHPRYKRQVAKRLTYGAYSLAYGLSNHGPYQGPFPTSVEVQGYTVEVTYDNGNANLDIRHDGNFDLCCADLPTDRCEEGNGDWIQTFIAHSSGTSVALDNPCSNAVTGVRYAWRISPCAFEMCSVYGVENELPAPPFILDI